MGIRATEESTKTEIRRARLAVSVVFIVNGFAIASWISRIPRVTDDLGLGSGRTGIALMAIAAGAIVSFPLAGRTIDRRSSALTIQIAALFLLALPFAGLAPHLLLLMPVLFLFGAGIGAMDVAMNAQGVEVERLAGFTIMNALHGFFSIGAFAGAAAGAGAAHLDLPVTAHFLVVIALCAAAMLWVRGWLIPDAPDSRAEEASPTFAFPPRSLWMLGALAVCVSVSEGAMADWSGLYLRDELGTEQGVAALGYAAFSICMLIGRFSGDRLVRRYGEVLMVGAGCALAAIALGIAILVNVPASMLIGFGAAGLGLSVAYPMVFSAAGNHRDLPRGRAVASIATAGYTGFLAGPPLLGWLAEFTSLRAILVTVVVLTAFAATLARSTRNAGSHTPAGATLQPSPTRIS